MPLGWSSGGIVIGQHLASPDLVRCRRRGGYGDRVSQRAAGDSGSVAAVPSSSPSAALRGARSKGGEPDYAAYSTAVEVEDSRTRLAIFWTDGVKFLRKIRNHDRALLEASFVEVCEYGVQFTHWVAFHKGGYLYLSVEDELHHRGVMFG